MGSPAICSAKRVHRAQETHRSRSSRICALMLIGFSKVRFSSSKREVPRPAVMAWFWRGHSPPLSHTGQSRGWLRRRNSITPSCAVSAMGDVRWVRTTIPSVTAMAQAG